MNFTFRRHDRCKNCFYSCSLTDFSGYRRLLTEDPTELEILIERIQYCLQEESDDNNHVGKRVRYL
jgi:hypothetical protein